MKKVIAVLVLLLALAGAVWYVKFSGVTHEEIYAAVREESAETRRAVDDRYLKLDRKLDRIESKLDKLLEIANRPLPDNLQAVE